MAGVWHDFGASGSTWISTGGPSMQGNARCGHVLKVEEAYCSRSHAFMRPLLSGVHGKGSLAGPNGVAARWGQEHDSSLLALGVLQPSLMDLTSDVAGCTFLVLWGMSLLRFTPLGLSADVKICDRMPRFSRDSYDKYMALTELLTYTIDQHEDIDISAIADTGAQSDLWSLDEFLACGFCRDDLSPVSLKLSAANRSSISIEGAFFAKLTAKSRNGEK